MSKILLIIMILSINLSLCAVEQSSYYYQTRTIDKKLFNNHINWGHLGQSNHGLEWGALAYWYGVNRFSIGAEFISSRENLTDPIREFERDNSNADWNLKKDITGRGLAFGNLSLRANLYSFGHDNSTRFNPLNFIIAPYAETSFFGLANNTKGEGEFYLFPFFDFGLILQSSLFYAKAAYTYNVSQEVSSLTDTKMILTGANSGLTIAAGVNINLYDTSNYFHQRINKNKRYAKPNLRITGQSIRGSAGNLIMQDDVGYISLAIENSGSVDAVNHIVELKQKGSYPGINIQNPGSITIRKGDYYNLSIPVTMKNVSPGEKHYSLTLTDQQRNYEIEVPFSFTTMPTSKGSNVSSSMGIIYDPTELNFNIPTGSPNLNRKALIIYNENYRNDRVAQIKVASNTVRVLKEYLNKTLGIQERNIWERKDATINEIHGLFDPNDGFLARNLSINDDLIIYILSHGKVVSIGRDKVTHILCYDSDPFSSVPERVGIPVTGVVQNLDRLALNNYVFMIDACYSGTLVGVLAPTTELKQDSIRPQKGAVLTSSDGMEVANLMEDIGHTVFSYHLLSTLQKLGNQRKAFTVDDLHLRLADKNDGIPAYIMKRFGSNQTPQLFGKKNIRLVN